MVTQCNSGRVTCLVKSDFLAEAQKTIDYFLDTFIPSLEPESQARITFPNKPPIRIGRSILPDHIAIVTQAIRSLEVDFNFDDDSFLSAYSTPPPANNSYNNKKRTYASALSDNSTHTTQPNTISPTTASDLTTERSSRIDKLLAQLATKNTTLEATRRWGTQLLRDPSHVGLLSIERVSCRWLGGFLCLASVGFLLLGLACVHRCFS
jgi:hypothetical protein